MLSRLLMAGVIVLPMDAWADDEPGRNMAVVARTCITCHHPDNQAIPRLPGNLNREQLVARLQEMRGADRGSAKNTVMHRLLGAFDDPALEALADKLTGGSS